MKKLKALLIGINDYPIAEHCLSGCIPDLLAMKEVLENHHNSDSIELDLEILYNENATRQRVIDTFLSHFGSMSSEDIGLFYFSGHGSRSKGPREFWVNKKNRKHESIVCYDSRQSNGYDLADKELGWMIWKVTNGKKGQFIVILDCCHSGSGTRGEEPLESKTKIRCAIDSHNSRKWTEYVGAKDYILLGGKRFPPEGKHILLSACKKKQSAREKIIGGNTQPMGVFTYCLINQLKRGEFGLTALITEVAKQVSVLSEEQNSRIKSNYGEGQHSCFLEGHLIKCNKMK